MNLIRLRESNDKKRDHADSQLNYSQPGVTKIEPTYAEVAEEEAQETRGYLALWTPIRLVRYLRQGRVVVQ